MFFLFLQARIQSRNEYGFSAESVLDLFQTFDIREASTQATTDLFQKIGERQNDYYQDAPTTKKDLHVINSEPLSTNSEKGEYYVCLCERSELCLTLPFVLVFLDFFYAHAILTKFLVKPHALFVLPSRRYVTSFSWILASGK